MICSGLHWLFRVGHRKGPCPLLLHIPARSPSSPPCAALTSSGLACLQGVSWMQGNLDEEGGNTARSNGGGPRSERNGSLMSTHL